MQITKERVYKVKSFNRTFMELKYQGSWSNQRTNLVLIVPLWNWNELEELVEAGYLGFNRTFMELKLM